MRVLAAGTARLSKPRLVAVFGGWRRSWESSEANRVQSSNKTLKKQIEDLRVGLRASELEAERLRTAVQKADADRVYAEVAAADDRR